MNPSISYRASFSFSGDVGKSPYIIRGAARSEIVSASLIPVRLIETGGTGFHADSNSEQSIVNFFNIVRTNRQIGVFFVAQDSLPNVEHPDWPRLSGVVQKLSRFRGTDIPLSVSLGIQRLSSGKRIEAYTLRDNAATVGSTNARITPTGMGRSMLAANYAVELNLSSPEIRQGLVEDHFVRMASF